MTSPTRAYQHIFQEVNEAIGMFYFLADKYRKTRKRFVGASAKSCEKCVKSWFNEVCPRMWPEHREIVPLLISAFGSISTPIAVQEMMWTMSVKDFTSIGIF